MYHIKLIYKTTCGVEQFIIGGGVRGAEIGNKKGPKSNRRAT